MGDRGGTGRARTVPAANRVCRATITLFRLLDTDTNARAALVGGDWIAFEDPAKV